MTAQFQFFQSLPNKKADFVKKKLIELGVHSLMRLHFLETVWGRCQPPLPPKYFTVKLTVRGGGRSAFLADSNELTNFGETLTTAWSQLGFLLYLALNSQVCFASGSIMHQHQRSSLAISPAKCNTDLISSPPLPFLSMSVDKAPRLSISIVIWILS